MSQEKLFDIFVTDIEAAAKAVTPGVTSWYAVEAKKFQNGFQFVFIEETSKFEFSDTTSAAAIASKIITNASARDVNNVVTLKVAKTSGSTLVKLTAAEKASFSTYLELYKIAGTKTLVISDDPDDLKLAYTIEFDPQLIDSSGVLISDGTTKTVQKAINGYIQDLPFDATFRVQDLTDAIQLALGVVNAVADVVEAKFAATSFSDILLVTNESYIPNAGYLATVDETGTEAVPVQGDINVLTPLDYDDTSTSYAIGDFARFNGIVFKSNAVQSPGAFDPAKWDTVSNLTFISI